MKTITDKEWDKLSYEEKKSFSGIVKWWDGTIQYVVNGFEHREDGPAYEILSGYKEWRIKGKLHRIDGPAIIYSNGEKEYWIHGKKYTKEVWQKHLQVIKNSEQFKNIMKYKEIKE